jgi:hypothetical protein
MVEEVHPFTARIEADPLDECRFRWTVCEGNQIHIRSPHSYATRREANMGANEAMLRLAATWRRNK